MGPHTGCLQIVRTLYNFHVPHNQSQWSEQPEVDLTALDELSLTIDVEGKEWGEEAFVAACLAAVVVIAVAAVEAAAGDHQG